MDQSSIVKSVSTSAFEAFIGQHSVIFVDFWASWCAPCRQFAHVYEQVAAKYPDITFVKVNIEEEHELAEMFHIRSIPHLMVFKQGIVIYSEAGSMPESALSELAQQALAADVSDIQRQLNEEK
jgi:thioredoxin 1